MDDSDFEDDDKRTSLSSEKREGTKGTKENPIRICTATWGGYQGGPYFNKGYEANAASRFVEEYGIWVEFINIDDFGAGREAFKAGEVDMIWSTVDSLPCEAEMFASIGAKIVHMVDWSRGGDAMPVTRDITSIND